MLLLLNIALKNSSGLQCMALLYTALKEGHVLLIYPNLPSLLLVGRSGGFLLSFFNATDGAVTRAVTPALQEENRLEGMPLSTFRR